MRINNDSSNKTPYAQYHFNSPVPGVPKQNTDTADRVDVSVNTVGWVAIIQSISQNSVFLCAVNNLLLKIFCEGIRTLPRQLVYMGLMNKITAGHQGPIGSLLKVGNYNGYILEYRLYDLQDEVTNTLDQNFKKISEQLGSEAIYVLPTGLDESEIPDKIKEEYSSYPVITVFDKHPSVIHPTIAEHKITTLTKRVEKQIRNRGVNCVSFQLGNVSDSTDVTEIYKILIRHMRDPNFIQNLTWQKRKRVLSKSLSPIIDVGSIGLTVLSLAV
jgi:hypothetical protein